MITSDLLSHSGDYLWSPFIQLYLPLVTPHAVVMTSGPIRAVVNTSGHTSYLPLVTPHIVVIASGHLSHTAQGHNSDT